MSTPAQEQRFAPGAANAPAGRSPWLPFEDLEKGLSAESLDRWHETIAGVIRAPNLIFEQKRDALAAAAMKSQPYPEVSAEARELIRERAICLIAEGAAPYHPRYCAPDYARLLREGSAFMELAPARDLHEATAHLITAYHYIPSNGLPMFLGRLDELLEPYIDTVSEESAKAVIRAFWLLVDRLSPSAFVHGNIGPQATRAGRYLLEADLAVRGITNLTLRYDPEITPDDFAIQGVLNALELAKPYFLNHRMMLRDWGEDYAIASCYNSMRIGGGIYTLVRLNWARLAELSDGTIEGYLNDTLPRAAEKVIEVVSSRVRFLVEEVKFFEHDFWVREGLLKREHFTAYVGVFGLAEAVNLLARPGERYGKSEAANDLALRIVQRTGDLLGSFQAPYCEARGGHVSYHAQVGIDSDQGESPGIRIPVGEEGDLYNQILAEAPLHGPVEGGVSSILEFDQTARNNPQGVLDIIKGAHASGARMLSIGGSESEFVRVTGYLVRRSDIEASQAEKALRHSSAPLASGFFEVNPTHLHRRPRQV